MQREQQRFVIEQLNRTQLAPPPPLSRTEKVYWIHEMMSNPLALEMLCDPANYLGEAGAMVDRVLAMRKD